MSLPLATASTAEHPPAGAVTSPVDKKAKDADVDRKVRPLVRVRLTPVLISIFQLRFYGVIEAFRQGRYPSNKQIDRTLKHLLDSSPVDQSKLSPEGRKLIQDSRDVIETARLMVEKKNADELFQTFLWHTRNVDFDKAKKDPSEVLPVDKEKSTQDSQQGAASPVFCLTVARLLICLY